MAITKETEPGLEINLRGTKKKSNHSCYELNHCGLRLVSLKERKVKMKPNILIILFNFVSIIKLTSFKTN